MIPREPPLPEPAPPGAASLLRQLQDLLQDLPGLVGDRVELLLLELQRAARALVQIVALGVAAAILGVTAWLLLWAGAIRLLMLAGLSMDGALLVALAVNGLALGVALQRLRRLLPELSLPATRRHLLPPGDPDEPD